MEKANKIVNFRFCKICEHYEKEDWEDPCNECLGSPAREDSKRPIYYKEKEKISQEKHGLI